MELHRLGGMYVANDFQRLMMRKEVENWRGGVKDEGQQNGGSGADIKNEPRDRVALLDAPTAVEVIN